MDKISTMTLTEFKSLLNSALAVPPPQAPKQTPDGKPLDWGAVRAKAMAVRDSISTSQRRPVTSSVRPSTALGTLTRNGGLITPVSRPKTPTASTTAGTTAAASVISRPKTPTSKQKAVKCGIHDDNTFGITRGSSGPKAPSQVCPKFAFFYI